VRWEALERDLFSPVYSHIAQASALLLYLSELSSNSNVIAHAQQIVSTPGEPSTSYELIDDEWIMKKASPFSSPQRTTPPAADPELNQIMSHVHEMEERLAFLERQLRATLPGNDAGPSVIPMANDETPHSSTG